MGHRFEATSVEGFVQQVACSYLQHGYWWYVTGVVPARKDPRELDAKLAARYGLTVSKREKARRKERGLANLHYLRHGHFFALFATQGRHPFYVLEGERVRDIRKVPLRYRGYAISYRPGGRTRSGERDPNRHAHVQIDRERFKEERAYLLELATRRPVEALAREFRQIPFEPYAPVRRQLLALLRAVNDRRKAAGLSPVPPEVLRLRRRVVKPFEPLGEHLKWGFARGEENPGVTLTPSSAPEPVRRRPPGGRPGDCP
jgi:hypothetical protein